MDNVFKQLTVMQDSTLILADTYGSNAYISESGHAQFAGYVRTVLLDSAALSDSLTLAVNSTPVMQITPPNIDCKNLNLININNLISQTQTITETINVASNLLIVNSGLTGVPPSTLISGIQVNRGSEVSYFFGLREADQSFVLGQYNIDSSTYQNILTRQSAPISNGLFYYNSSLYQASSDSSLTFDPINKILSATTLNATSNIELNNTTILSGNTLGSSITSSSLQSVGALSSGSIGGSFGSINIGSNSLTAGPIVCTTLNAASNIQINGATILSGSTLSSQITASSLQSVGALSSGSIASGFGNINIGTNSIIAGYVTCLLVSSNNINLTIGGTYSINSVSVLSASTLGSSILNSSLTSVGALNSGSISSGFGSIAINSAGTYSIGSSIVLSASTLGSSVHTSSLTSVGALASGSIASGFGSINIGSNALTCGAVTCTTLNASTNIQLNGTIVLTSNVLGSLITASSLTSVGALTAGSIAAGFGSINIGSNALTCGPIICSSSISGTSMNLAAGNSYSINSVSVLSSSTLGSSVLTSSLTSVGALNSGSITSGFGSIAIGLSNSYSIGTNIVLSGNTLGSSITSSSLTAVGSLSSGSIASGFGNINIGSNSLTCGSLNSANPLQIQGVQVLSSTALGGLVISSNLSQVGALTSGSIASGFGSINIGSNALSAGYLTLNPISNNVGLSITNVGTGNCLSIQNSGSLMAILDKNMNFSLSGNVSVATGSSFQINGTSVLYGSTLGSTITNSYLTSVGALTSGSIASGFGNINIGGNQINAGYLVLAPISNGITLKIVQPYASNCFTIQNAASSPTLTSYMDYNHNLTVAGNIYCANLNATNLSGALTSGSIGGTFGNINIGGNQINAGFVIIQPTSNGAPLTVINTNTGFDTVIFQNNASYASATIKSYLDYYHNLTLAGSLNLSSSSAVYQIAGTTVLSASTLGSYVYNSSLTSVGALASGSIASGFGNINIGTNALTCGAINGSGTLQIGSGSGLSGYSVELYPLSSGWNLLGGINSGAGYNFYFANATSSPTLQTILDHNHNLTLGGNLTVSGTISTTNALSAGAITGLSLLLSGYGAGFLTCNGITCYGPINLYPYALSTGPITAEVSGSSVGLTIINPGTGNYFTMQSSSGLTLLYSSLDYNHNLYIGNTITCAGLTSNGPISSTVSGSSVGLIVSNSGTGNFLTLQNSSSTTLLDHNHNLTVGGSCNVAGVVSTNQINLGNTVTNSYLNMTNNELCLQSFPTYSAIQFGGSNSGTLYVHYYTGGQGPYISAGSQNWTSGSDIRLKTNIQKMTGCLEALSSISSYYYNYIADADSNHNYSKGKKRIGFIAQEILPLYPEIIEVDKDDYYGVKYAEMTPIVAGAVNELSAIVTLQAATIASQATAITSMQAAIAALQASVAALQKN